MWIFSKYAFGLEKIYKGIKAQYPPHESARRRRRRITSLKRVPAEASLTLANQHATMHATQPPVGRLRACAITDVRGVSANLGTASDPNEMLCLKRCFLDAPSTDNGNSYPYSLGRISSIKWSDYFLHFRPWTRVKCQEVKNALKKCPFSGIFEYFPEKRLERFSRNLAWGWRWVFPKIWCMLFSEMNLFSKRRRKN
jgi:hypothetical protein